MADDVDYDDNELVRVRILRKNWDGIKYEAAMSGDTETDIINRSAGFYVFLRDELRTPGTHLALLTGVELADGIIRVGKDTVVHRVLGLGPDDDPHAIPEGRPDGPQG